MSKKIELPPVLTIMAVLVIGKLLGPLGLVIALPMLVTVMVIVRRILINRIYEGKGFRKSTRDRIFVLAVPAPDGGVLVPPSRLTTYFGFKETGGDGVPPISVASLSPYESAVKG